MNLGAVLVREGQTGEARPLLEAAASYQREHHRGYYLANTLQDLAALHRVEGDYRRALDLAVEAVGEATRAQLPQFLAGPLGELARAQLGLGDEAGARVALAEARAIYAELGDVARAATISREIDAISGGAAPVGADGAVR